MTNSPVKDEILMGLEDDFHVDECQGGRLAVRRDLWPAFREVGFTLGGRVDWAVSDLSGRRPLGEFEAQGESFLVRHFQHGGMFRWLTGERFAEATRPFEEVRLARELTRRGIATLDTVAARAESVLPFGWRLELVTRRLPGVLDVAHFLESVRRGEVPARVRHALARAFGELVGRLHGIDFEHADLTPRNVLMESEPWAGSQPRLWLIDLDRSRFHDSMTEEIRRRNLRRLFRFIRRREARGEAYLNRSDVARFLRGYGAGLGEEGFQLRELWRAVLRDDRRRDRWHKLGWAAEEFLGAGPENRDG